MFYYKLGQTLLQIGVTSLLQIGACFVTYWGTYYKLGQLLLQNRAAITNWGKTYYQLGQVLQIRGIITNWGITYMQHYEWVFDNVFKRRESECCAVLMKDRSIFKGEQVITIQIAQQLISKNINVVLGQLFCR